MRESLKLQAKWRPASDINANFHKTFLNSINRSFNYHATYESKMVIVKRSVNVFCNAKRKKKLIE